MEPLTDILPSGEEQCRLAVTEAREGIWAWDIASDRIFWSHRIYEMLGRPAQEEPLNLETVLSFIPDGDWVQLKQIVRPKSYKMGDNAFSIDFRMRHQSGQYRHIHFKGKVLVNAEGFPVRVSGLAEDVTEHVQAITALKQSQKDLGDIRHALDESTIVAVTDSHGVIQYANEAFCRISKYSQEELIGKTHRIINSGYHPKAFFKAMWDTISQGGVWKGEIRNKAKDGTLYWVDTTIVPFLDEGGKPIHYIAIRHDITHQKDAEEEVRALNADLERRVEERTLQLRNINLSLNEEIEIREKVEQKLRYWLKREKLLKHLLQMMNHSFNLDFILNLIAQEIGIFFGVDRCLVIYYEGATGEEKQVRIASQYCRSTNIKPIPDEQVPWKVLQELQTVRIPAHPLLRLNASVPEQFPPTTKQFLIEHGVQSVLSIEIQYRDNPFGCLVLHQCDSQRIWTEEDIEFMETLIFHIGAAWYQAELHQQEKQAESEAVEANRQKTKVLSYVSHDFKNPLDGILRFVEILEADKEDVLSDKQREIVGYIGEGVHQLRNMVTAILDKARLEEGRMVPALSWIELRSFIEQLRPLLCSLAADNNIEVDIQIDPTLHVIKTDATHFRQIIINLFSNAVKYNQPHGKVKVRFSKSPDEQFLLLEVEDTGIGIPEEKIPELFKDYYRTNLFQVNLVEGTGLGLSFIKRLIELHHGHITVTSQVGIGSTFKVMLPLVTPPHEETAV